MGSVWGSSDVLIGCVSVAIDVLVTCVSVALEVVVTSVSVSCGLVEEDKTVVDGADVVMLLTEESLVPLPQDNKRSKSRKIVSDTANFFILTSPLIR